MATLTSRLRTLETRVSPGSFVGLLTTTFVVSTCLFIFRLPMILIHHEFNVDESQMLSQAMKFMVDMVPWRAVDGTSSGPINSYLLTIFLSFGLKPSYALAHILATALVCLQVIVAHQTLLRLGSRDAAAWGILPMIFCYGFSNSLDYYFYSSELLPALLLALGFHGFVIWLEGSPDRKPSRQMTLLFFIGLALGAAPWCKLQALPIAAAIGVVVLLATIFYRGHTSTKGQRLRQSVALCAGALVTGGLILSCVVRAGVIRDFWSSYILGNIAYAGSANRRQVIGHLAAALNQNEVRPLLFSLVVGIPLFAFCFFAKRKAKLSSKDRWVLAALALFFGSALFAICRPTYFFPHYTTLIIYPMTCLMAILISKGLSIFSGRILAGVEIAGKAFVFIALSFLTINLLLEIAKIETMPPWQDSNQKIAEMVQQASAAHPVHSMAIWGWAPGAYVLTGIPPATRDAIGHFIISPGPLQPYFRNRFLGDLREKMPDLFLDTVARGAFMWFWSERDGYESDDELRQFIDQNYMLIDQLTLARGAKPVRLFARRGILSGKLATGSDTIKNHRQLVVEREQE